MTVSAVPVRQPEVEDHEVRPARLPGTRRLGCARRFADRIAVRPQVGGNELGDGSVVLDEENLRRHE